MFESRALCILQRQAATTALIAVAWLLATPAAAQSDADAGVSEQPDAESVAEPSPAPAYRAVAVATGPGAGLTLDAVPNNAQSLDASALHAQHALSISDALQARLGSVTLNDVQSSPLQPDLQYRGFSASPLLGTPQGISVYQNGVRLNEPFGDVLQWDLIPMFAISDAQILPGVNATHGLNSLGGSLLLNMKTGWNARGTRIEGSAGSFGRYRLSAEHGHAAPGWAAYVGASLFGEQGFRDHSPASARNLFADVRQRSADHEVGVSLTLAQTDLQGNGPSPVELLRRSRAAVYTWPDHTQNDLVLLGVDGRQRLARGVSLRGSLYLRHLQRATLNGDRAELGTCQDATGESVLCSEQGVPLRSTFGQTVAPGVDYDAVSNTTRTSTNGFGGSLQLNARRKLADHENLLIVGASYDGARTSFEQRTELGRLTVERAVEGGGPSLAGPGMQTELLAITHAVGVYVVDTFNITQWLALQASARLNWFGTKLSDGLGDDLDGQHAFVRLNPAIGLTQRLSQGVSLFASYGESNRAPSAAELACADPEAPCRLPNAFISDPPLEQVVSRSAELGLRVRAGEPERPWLSASLAAFFTRNYNDILFVAGSRVGTGYFQNAGQTQRVGLEASLSADAGPLRLYASYMLLRATFESELTLPRNAADDDAAADSGEDAGTQQVEKGSRIPGLPLHVVKAGVSYRVFAPLELGLSLLGQSSQPFRGDEANESAFVNGHVVVNAQASYQLLRELHVFVRAQNVLNTRYSTFGVLANPGEVLPNASDPRFLGPGAPFGIWAGVVFVNPS